MNNLLIFEKLNLVYTRSLECTPSKVMKTVQKHTWNVVYYFYHHHITPQLIQVILDCQFSTLAIIIL